MTAERAASVRRDDYEVLVPLGRRQIIAVMMSAKLAETS
jgi:hypothetical protein